MTNGIAQKTTKQLRSERRRQLKGASLETEAAWWADPARRKDFPAASIASELRRIAKEHNRILKTAPSGCWWSDAYHVRRDAGGAFPPCDEWGTPLMVRGKGECRFYPLPYITSSGHSYDVYADAVYSGASQHLTEDGYNGSRVFISTLTRVDQARIRRRARRGINKDGTTTLTNVL